MQRLITGRVAATLVAAVLLAACGGGGAGSPSASSSSGAQRADTGAPQTSYPSPTSAAVNGIVADTGFRPDANGFSFENYGNSDYPDLTNLTAAEMVDMFGPGVCVNTVDNTCTLTPEAQAWMNHENDGMSGGHCQGMSVTALLFYKGALKPSDFGGATVPDLQIQGNAPLQRRIAESFEYQAFPGVRQGTIHGTPSQIVDALTAGMQSKTTTYGLGIYKPGRTGGHEITPIAILDLGNGKVAIAVYDNNYPKTIRQVVVDRSADTWAYDGSTNPGVSQSEYAGDATTNTLEIDPLEPGLGTQPCPFCQQATQAAYRNGPTVPQATDTTQYEEVFLDGNPSNHGHLVITDKAGNHSGYVNGAFVNDVPGVQVMSPRLGADWAEAEEPTYLIPTGTDIAVTIDGSPLVQPDTENIGMIGPTDDVVIEGINLNPGDSETFAVSADRTIIAYAPHGTETPTILVGISDPSADYAFSLKGAQLGSGATLAIGIDPNQLVVDTTSVQGDGTYDVQMLREDKTGTLTFKHSGLPIPAGVKANLVYGVWSSDGTAIPLVIDRSGTQTTSSVSDEP